MSLPTPGRGHRLLAIAFTSVALASCSSTAPRADGLPQSELGAHRRKWSARGIAGYRYTLRHVCFCASAAARAATVAVRNGAVSSGVYTDDGSPVAEESLRSFLTVEQLFQLVQDALDRNVEDLQVTYDAVYGYPRSIRIDFRKAVDDDEHFYTASDLEPVGP